MVKVRRNATRPRRKSGSTTRTSSRSQQLALVRTPAPVKPKVSQQAVQAVCALTDPFCEHAVGVKTPDTGLHRTVTEQIRYQVAVQADANGNGAIAFKAHAANPYALATTQAAGGNVTAFAAPAALPFTSLFSTYGEEVRVVNAGVRVLNTASATNSSGYLIVGKKQTVSSGDAIAFTLTAMDTARTFSLHHGMQAVGIHRKLSVSADTFDTAGQAATHWDNIVFIWVGAPVGATLVFEHVMNVEFSLSTTGTGHNAGSFATPSRPINNALTSVVSKVQAKLGDFVSGTVEALGNKVVAIAGGAIAAKLMGPTAGSTAYALLSDSPEVN